MLRTSTPQAQATWQQGPPPHNESEGMASASSPGRGPCPSGLAGPRGAKDRSPHGHRLGLAQWSGLAG